MGETGVAPGLGWPGLAQLCIPLARGEEGEDERAGAGRAFSWWLAVLWKEECGTRTWPYTSRTCVGCHLGHARGWSCD